MHIKFSRHAKRRARLYKITESTIENILDNADLVQGKNELVREVNGFSYPLKIVVNVGEDTITVITNYPLKRGRGK